MNHFKEKVLPHIINNKLSFVKAQGGGVHSIDLADFFAKYELFAFKESSEQEINSYYFKDRENSDCVMCVTCSYNNVYAYLASYSFYQFRLSLLSENQFTADEIQKNEV